MIKTYDQAYKSLSKYDSDFFMSIMLAQWALESDYGKSELATQANNYTGHKTTGWSGEVYLKDTIEDDGKGNKFVAKSEPFRKYASPDDWAKAHASWLQRLPEVYAKAINAKTVEEQAGALQGTYATDTSYKKKLLDIIERDNLKQYDKKESSPVSNKPALNIEVKLLGNYRKSFGRNSSKKIGITLHQSGAPQANWNADRMHQYQVDMSQPTNKEEKSWHWQVDDRKAIQSFPHDVGCWAASDGDGPGNMNTIQIESCINAGSDYAKTIANTAKLMAWICYTEGFNPKTQIYTHYHWSKLAGRTKWCPQQILNGQQGFTLAKVIDMTVVELANLKAGGTSPVNDGYNPQGLEVIDIPAYREPKLPFDEIKEGQTVEIRDPFKWYDDANKTFMVSKKEAEIIGTKDKVKAVKEIEPIGYSKRAYLLEGYNSWILEQDLVEARDSWKEVPEPVEDGKESPKIEDGLFRLNGNWYKVSQVID